MKNAALGALAGLVLGTVCALAYGNFLTDGKFLADLKTQITINL
jgi:hypothetical protein